MIEKSEMNGASTLKLIGELDLHAVPELRAKFLAFASAKTPVLLVDFQKRLTSIPAAWQF